MMTAMAFQSPNSNQYTTTDAISPPPPPIHHHPRRSIHPSDNCSSIPKFLHAQRSVLNENDIKAVENNRKRSNIPLARPSTDENAALLLLSSDVPRMTKPLRRRPTCGECTHDSKRVKSLRSISIFCPESIPPPPWWYSELTPTTSRPISTLWSEYSDSPSDKTRMFEKSNLELCVMIEKLFDWNEKCILLGWDQNPKVSFRILLITHNSNLNLENNDYLFFLLFVLPASPHFEFLISLVLYGIQDCLKHIFLILSSHHNNGAYISTVMYNTRHCNTVTSFGIILLQIWWVEREKQMHK